MTGLDRITMKLVLEPVSVRNDKNLTKSLALAAIAESERAETVTFAPAAMAA